MAFGIAGIALRGLNRLTRKEGFDDPAMLAAQDRELYIAELILFLAVLGVAVVVASRCGGGFRQYAGAVLEPYVFLVIRLVVPCAASKA